MCFILLVGCETFGVDLQFLSIFSVESETQTHTDYLQDILYDHAEKGNLFGFDGYEALAGFIGDYVQNLAAVDLTQRIRTDSEISQQWINILPYYRQSNGVFDNKVYMLPVSYTYFSVKAYTTNKYLFFNKNFRQTTMVISCFTDGIFSICST